MAPKQTGKRRTPYLSILTTFGSAICLILIGINTICGEPDPEDSLRRQFATGPNLQIQAWTAILGLIVSGLSFSLLASVQHLYDCVCSRLATAKGSRGLPYAKYLNTLPHAPVLLGIRRGFAWYVMTFWLASAMIALWTIGYKFSIIQVEGQVREQISEDLISLRIPPAHCLDEDTGVSEWFDDRVSYQPLVSGEDFVYQDPVEILTNKAFIHRLSGDPEEDADRMGTGRIVMVGSATCASTLFNGADSGILYTSENVLVAEVVDSVIEPGRNFTIHDIYWQTLEPDVINNVQFKIQSPGAITIRRAGLVVGQGADPDLLGTASIEQEQEIRVYRHRFIVARRVVNGTCQNILPDQTGYLVDGRVSKDPPSGPQQLVETYYEDGTSYSVGPILQTGCFSGSLSFQSSYVNRKIKSIIVRANMAVWGTDIETIRQDQSRQVESLGHNFYRSDRITGIKRLSSKDPTRYPLFEGTRLIAGRGGYVQAACVEIGLGVVFIIIGLVRWYIGPPELTSWAGQHVSVVCNTILAPSGGVGMEVQNCRPGGPLHLASDTTHNSGSSSATAPLAQNGPSLSLINDLRNVCSKGYEPAPIKGVGTTWNLILDKETTDQGRDRFFFTKAE
ncbi:hypothetical protein FOPE_09452 [Fonsecaea pedrosoi]|nr:hypothetical protein FOPE_09452 [Fonsecaea pedrosoi]